MTSSKALVFVWTSGPETFGPDSDHTFPNIASTFLLAIRKLPEDLFPLHLSDCGKLLKSVQFASLGKPGEPTMLTLVFPCK